MAAAEKQVKSVQGINILSRLLGNATNNLWVLDSTLNLLGIRQAELQLIITLLILLWL
jgi:hypothetical protein